MSLRHRFPNLGTTLPILTLLLIIVVSPLRAAPAADVFLLQNGQRVVFFGDSITQAGLYVQYVDAYLVTRFPDRQIEIINHGISSETVSGTTEIDHDPPRPDAHKRFTRDITAWKPDVVVACFGMNDGNYFPPDEAPFEAYQRGVQRLLRRCRKEAGAERVVLLTPPPFDPYRRRASDPDAVAFGYKYPAINYDQTLTQFAAYLTSLRNDGVPVVDLHTAMNAHVKQRRQERVSFSLSPDAVHPDATGHWLMAQHFLLACNAPAVSSEAGIRSGTVVEGSIVELRQEEDQLRFVWTTPLPMPMDPRWDKKSIALERVCQRLNRHRLTIEGLAEGSWQLGADGKPIASFSAGELAEGVNLVALPDFPTVRRAAEVLALVQKKHQLVYSAWRKSFPDRLAKRQGDGGQAMRDAEEPAAEIERQIRALCRPTPVRISLVRSDGTKVQ